MPIDYKSFRTATAEEITEANAPKPKTSRVKNSVMGKKTKNNILGELLTVKMKIDDGRMMFNVSGNSFGSKTVGMKEMMSMMKNPT